MSTEALPEVSSDVASPPERSRRKLYRVTVDQYLKMIEAGVFDRRGNVELLGGVLVATMIKKPPHNFGVASLSELLRRFIPLEWLIREEKSLVLSTQSRPEPDILIARGPHTLYRGRDPEAREAAIVVEVASSTYFEDRGQKWRLYAEAKIPSYWIVNIPQRRIEVYTEPTGLGKAAAYQQSTIYDEAAEVPVVIDGQERGRLVVRDVLA